MLYLYMNYFFLVSSLFIAGVFTGCQFDGKRQSNDKVTVVSILPDCILQILR